MQHESIHSNYVKEFTKLSLWFVHKRLCQGESDFEALVNGRVNIYRNTSLYDGKHHPVNGEAAPEWNDILKELRTVFDRYIDAASTEQLESVGLELLAPHLKRCADTLPPPETRPYECWTYDYGDDQLNIHILNVYQPRSPLSDMWVPFAASLIRLMQDSQTQRPDVKIVRCGSWLNSVPPFQKLFPERWKQSAEPRPEVRYTMGHWGQFTDRLGDFHARNGRLFRETGKFPFPNLRCECPINEALGHLQENFPDVVQHNRQWLGVPQDADTIKTST